MKQKNDREYIENCVCELGSSLQDINLSSYTCELFVPIWEVKINVFAHPLGFTGAVQIS